MEGKNPGEVLAAKVIDVGRSQLEVIPAQATENRSQSLRRSARAVAAAARLEHKTTASLGREMKLDGGDVVTQGEANYHAAYQVESNVRDGEDLEGALQTDPRFNEPLAVLQQEGVGKVNVPTPKSEEKIVMPKGETAAGLDRQPTRFPKDIPARGSLATDAEFEAITGVPNRMPEAVGVAVTQEVVDRYRREQAAKLVDSSGRPMDGSRDQMRLVALNPAGEPKQFPVKVTNSAVQPGLDAERAARAAGISWHLNQAKIAEDNAARGGPNSLGDKLAAEYLKERAETGKIELAQAEIDAGKRAIAEGEPLPHLSDEARALLIKEFYANPPGYSDVHVEGQEAGDPEEGIAKLWEGGKRGLSKRARVAVGTALLLATAATALIRRDSMPNNVPAVEPLPAVATSTHIDQKEVGPIIKGDASGEIQGPKEGSVQPKVETVDYEVQSGDGLSAILNKLNPGRYKQGDEDFGNQELLHADLKTMLKTNRDRLLALDNENWRKGYEQFYSDWDARAEALGREMSSEEFRAFLQEPKGPLFGGFDEKVAIYAGQRILAPKFPTFSN